MTVEYRQVCARCGSFDIEYLGSTHHPRWHCKSCRGGCDVKTVKVRKVDRDGISKKGY